MEKGKKIISKIVNFIVKQCKSVTRKIENLFGRKRKIIDSILIVAILVLFTLGTIGIFYANKRDEKVKLNIDTNNDGIAELNIDLGSGECKINCSKDGLIPYLNISYNDLEKAVFNIDNDSD